MKDFEPEDLENTTDAIEMARNVIARIREKELFTAQVAVNKCGEGCRNCGHRRNMIKEWWDTPSYTLNAVPDSKLMYEKGKK